MIEQTFLYMVVYRTFLYNPTNLKVPKKAPCLGKRRLRNDLVLTHKILFNHIDLDATQLFKFSRRPY